MSSAFLEKNPIPYDEDSKEYKMEYNRLINGYEQHIQWYWDFLSNHITSSSSDELPGAQCRRAVPGAGQHHRGRAPGGKTVRGT